MLQLHMQWRKPSGSAPLLASSSFLLLRLFCWIATTSQQSHWLRTINTMHEWSTSMSISILFAGSLKTAHFDLFTALPMTWLPTFLWKLSPRWKSSILCKNLVSLWFEGECWIPNAYETAPYRHNAPSWLATTASCAAKGLHFVYSTPLFSPACHLLIRLLIRSLTLLFY